MKLISDPFHSAYEVKHSTFTSYLVPYSLFKQTLKKLHEENPKANHIVWAYRYLNEFDQVVENSTDDGEPKGCAGNPTLSQLRGSDLINTALLTVRYFGGIKLGTGGMVRAYSDAAREVIQSAVLIPYKKRIPFILETSYALINRYEHFFKNKDIHFENRDFTGAKVIWHLHLTEDEIKLLQNFKQNLS